MLTVAASLALLSLVSPARAQVATLSEDGIKVGQGTVIHTAVGMAAGGMSNVFYEADDEDPSAAALLRFNGALHLASLPASRLGEGEHAREGRIKWRLSLGLSYEEYLSDVETIATQRNLMGNAKGSAEVNLSRADRVSISNDFSRITHPQNFEASGRIERNVNRFRAHAEHKTRRRLGYELSYENVLDVFTDDISAFANRVLHTISGRVAWRTGSRTHLRLLVAQSINRPLNPEGTASAPVFKNSSNPLRGVIEVDAAIAKKVDLRGYAGWAAGFYSQDESYSSPVAHGELVYEFADSSRARLVAEFEYRDSINSNFYRDALARAEVEHATQRFGLRGLAAVIARRYGGIPATVGNDSSREDTIFHVAASARFRVHRWLSAYVSYDLQTVSTDFQGVLPSGEIDDPSFVRQLVLAGITASL